MDEQTLDTCWPHKRRRISHSSAAMDDYDVFLNHRGPDVKGGFIAHLDEALRSVGLNPFLDKNSLVKGDPAFRSIDDALEVAKVHVAVISRGYAESKYCLRELVAMMRSGKPVIPVFYDVEPAHLRRVENGPFAPAFEKHMSRESAEQVEEWGDALQRLADISGFHFRLSDIKGDEVELKWDVVDAVMVSIAKATMDKNDVTSDDQHNRTIETIQEMIDKKKENDDVLQSDHEFINSLKNQMKVMTFMQVIEIEEAFLKLQDQAIIVLGFFNTVTDNIEFIFENGINMAKLVGIGLEHAKVFVRRGIIFEVQEIEAEKWKRIWLEVEGGFNRSFKIMKVTLPRTTLSRSCMENVQDGDASDSMEDYPKDGNDTVMTWSETLKVLFGNGISRLYGNNGDRGNQGENQEDGSGGGSGDGNGDDGHFHISKSKISLPKDRFAKSQVKVILLSGGNMEPLSNRQNKSIERLNNVKITPELTFDFYKSKDSKKIQITTSVIFGLDPECDGLDPECDGLDPECDGLDPECDGLDPDCDEYDCDGPNHFGWFHDRIRASIGLFDDNILNSVRLEHNLKEEEFLPGKTISKLSQAMEATNINERGIQGGGTIGSTQIAQVRFGANVNQKRERMDHQSNEQSYELVCNRTHPGSCSIIATPVMHKALLGYKYHAPPFNIVADCILDENYRERLSDHPTCISQKAKFSGTWVPNEDAEAAVYIFKSSRRLREIVAREDVSIRCSSSRFGKSKKEKIDVQVRATLECSITETYEKKSYVNYAMTHLIDGETYEMLESSNTQIPVQNLVNLL